MILFCGYWAWPTKRRLMSWPPCVKLDTHWSILNTTSKNLHNYRPLLNAYLHSCMYLATDLMIKNIAFYAYTKCIRLKWSPPRFAPYFYLQSITCKLKWNRSPYLQTMITLEKYATSSAIGFLIPDSRCQIKLTAVYNPASLDPGVYMNVFIPSNCELNQCNTRNVQLYISA